MTSRFITACVLFAMTALACPAFAQTSSPEGSAPKVAAKEKPQEEAGEVRVYQQIPLMKKGRLELGLISGVSVNDTAFIHLNGGAATRFHITQQWSVGASYHKYMRVRTGVEDTLTQEFGLFPERKFRDYYAGADVAWAPIYGKMLALESAISNFDVYMVLGTGVMRTFTQGTFGDNRISGNFGFGSRFYLGGWGSIQTEVRDYMYMETLQSGDALYQDWVISIGFSLFVPTTYEYRYQK